MASKADSLVDAGARALRAGEWAAARDAFRGALERAETAEALDGLGEALWWLGETHDSIRHRERAYALFRRRPDPARAANVALGLCILYRANVGDEAVAAGWLARAARLIDHNDLEELRGWLLLMRAGEAPTPAGCEQLARDAQEIATRSGDLDLELCAIAQVGSALVSQGRVAEGLSLLDEAMAGSLGGEGAAFDTIVFTSCNMIGSCTRCAEFERAVEWIRAADRFTKRYGCPFLFVLCRVLYASVLVATCDWVQAEDELQRTLKEAESSQAPTRAYALASLAGLRLAQGRLEEAAALIEGFDGQGPAAPVLAGIQLAQGTPVLAAATARRALDAAGEDQLERALLGELLGQAEIAQGRAADAATRGREMVEAGASLACRTIRARGLRLLGDAEGSREHLEAAIGEFARLGMPLEAARARARLAASLRATEPEVAEAEARAALSAFEGLGAGRDADAAAALLRDLGVKAARAGPKNLGTLTKREEEVLVLLGEGLSNPEIAARLYLSRKTVEHHVARILAKLGLRNRAEAAARAVRRQ